MKFKPGDYVQSRYFPGVGIVVPGIRKELVRVRLYPLHEPTYREDRSHQSLAEENLRFVGVDRIE